MSIRLVIADDHHLIIKGLEDIFRLEGDIEVVASCTDGSQALEAVRSHRPDVAVLDLHMPVMGGLAVARAVIKAKLPTRIVLLTADLEDDVLLEIAQLGIHGVVLKETAPRLLVQCIRAVHSGEQWLEQQVATRIVRKMLRREAGTAEATAQLTNREVELVRMAGRGLRNREIAEKLSISEGTVKVHLHNIFEKLQLNSRIALLHYAREKELV